MNNEAVARIYLLFALMIQASLDVRIKKLQAVLDEKPVE